MDPHEVLAVEPGRFTAEELKTKYRHMAERLHPTKCQLPPQEALAVMRRLTNCYVQLKEDLRVREAMRTSNQRTAALGNAEGDREDAFASIDPRLGERSEEFAKNMDMERFNRVFEETRLPDPHSGGHHDWFSREEPEEDELSHNLCDTDACDEPDAMSCISSKDLGFSDLGVTSLDNYGNPLRPARAQFTDLRDAHTARHNLMTSRMVQNFQEKPMRTLDALKLEREENASMRLSQEDLAEQQRIRAKKAEHDRRREAAIAEQNNLISKQFDRSRNILFGGAPSPAPAAQLPPQQQASRPMLRRRNVDL